MKRLLSRSEPPVEADPGFSAAVITWQRQHGRHGLPWQNTRDPYRIWLSEIMLQQTQVSAVIPYYQRFLERFPDVRSLAAADLSEVMALWSGLGYYSRARNLHRCAQQVCELHDGVFPPDPEMLQALPGIGRSTAAAISSFAYGTRAAIMDGNVKRVFCRVFGVEGYPGAKAVEQDLWARATALLPNEGMEAYTQGLMDLGATVCTRGRPRCAVCPLAQRCVALAQDRTAELPQARPKREARSRATSMLVVMHEGAFLLKQRPPSGIWGGLLSLPEFDAADAETLRARANEMGKLRQFSQLTPFSHAFTHYTLDVKPWLAELETRGHSVRDAAEVWLPACAIAEAPLPAPVKKLLLALGNREGQLPGA